MLDSVSNLSLPYVTSPSLGDESNRRVPSKKITLPIFVTLNNEDRTTKIKRWYTQCYGDSHGVFRKVNPSIGSNQKAMPCEQQSPLKVDVTTFVEGKQERLQLLKLRNNERVHLKSINDKTTVSPVIVNRHGDLRNSFVNYTSVANEKGEFETSQSLRRSLTNFIPKTFTFPRKRSSSVENQHRK